MTTLAGTSVGVQPMQEGLILLTGATGYVGSRLLRQLEAGGRKVRCLARQPSRVAAGRSTTEIVAGDCLEPESLDAAMSGVQQACYLVHSMESGAQFASLDVEAATNFGRAARKAGVRRIIYLGGLANDADSLSTHLQSRVETGQALRDSGVPVVEFRASVIIGSGSASFEMIRALVERLPAMICPRWVDTRTQPIAIDDVLAYLRGALELPLDGEAVFEIGGPDVVSYGDMMREYAKQRGLRRVLLPVPLLTPRLSGLWLALVTPAQARVGRALVEGLRNATVVRSPEALETFTIRPRPMREAFSRAIDEAGAAHFKTDRRIAVVDAPPAAAFAPIRRIGGATGWYFGDALWRLRGWIDSGLGGVGMRCDRRAPDDCIVGDIIDGWRVESYEPDRLLRLSVRMMLPGRGWLEFRVDPLDGGARSLIRQTASFDPRGISGRLYWYGVMPLHEIVFRGLIHRIAQQAVLKSPARHLSRFAAAVALAAAMTLLPAAAAAQTVAPVRTAPFVDLDRYSGDWFEIERFPNRFQRQCVGEVRAWYARGADGRVDVTNRCRTTEGETEARGVARIVDERSFAKLKVRFAPSWLSWLSIVWGDYWIIGIAPDYSWAVVGDPSRKYLWILARKPRLDDQSSAAARRVALENGYDTNRLVATPQSAPTPKGARPLSPLVRRIRFLW